MALNKILGLTRDDIDGLRYEKCPGYLGTDRCTCLGTYHENRRIVRYRDFLDQKIAIDTWYHNEIVNSPRLFMLRDGVLTKLPDHIMDCMLKKIRMEMRMKIHQLEMICTEGVLSQVFANNLIGAQLRMGNMDRDNAEYDRLYKKVQSAIIDCQRHPMNMQKI